MVTIRARSAWGFAIGICLLLVLAGCSREQQDWRAAEGADTIEAYGHFIQRHPDSELVSQARTRVVQLGEDRDWQHAGSADTVDAYREFLEQHPNGKWAQEARIRMQNFSLSEQTGTDAGTRSAAGAGGVSRGPMAAGAAGATGGVGAPNVAGGPDTPDHVTGTPAPIPDRASDASGSATGPRGGTSGSSRLAVPGESAVPLAAARGAGGPAPGHITGSPAAGPDRGSGASGSAAEPRAGSSAGPAAPPNTPATPPFGGSFGIQLGAFSSEAGASTQWHALTARFSSELQGLHEHIVPASTPSGPIYRLQADVGPEPKARAICESLRKHGQACVAVLPH